MVVVEGTRAIQRGAGGLKFGRRRTRGMHMSPPGAPAGVPWVQARRSEGGDLNRLAWAQNGNSAAGGTTRRTNSPRGERGGDGRGGRPRQAGAPRHAKLHGCI